jgi:hypothetical protein
MPNSIHPTDVLIEEYEEQDTDATEDFAFVVGPDGELKSFSVPQHLIEDPPESVQLILELFGIENIHELGQKIIH